MIDYSNILVYSSLLYLFPAFYALELNYILYFFWIAAISLVSVIYHSTYHPILRWADISFSLGTSMYGLVHSFTIIFNHSHHLPWLVILAELAGLYLWLYHSYGKKNHEGRDEHFLLHVITNFGMIFFLASYFHAYGI